MSDAFDILGIEPGFRLDPGVLADVHQKLSATLHPDRYVGRPASERRAALGRAIEVNEAYRVLKQPIDRGQLLLARLGVSPETEVDQEFLMDILELREALRDAGDAQDEDKIEELAERIRHRRVRAETELSELFEQALLGESPAPKLARLLAELRYFERFLTEADALLDELP
jgi:molecular chaperone HscB